MEKHYVKFEMENGDTHSYEIDDTTMDGVYAKLVSSPDGWIEFVVDDETHFLKAAKIVRVKIFSESAKHKRDGALEAAAEAFRNITF